jgi:hypothetical protein
MAIAYFRQSMVDLAPTRQILPAIQTQLLLALKLVAHDVRRNIADLLGRQELQLSEGRHIALTVEDRCDDRFVIQARARQGRAAVTARTFGAVTERAGLGVDELPALGAGIGDIG